MPSAGPLKQRNISTMPSGKEDDTYLGFAFGNHALVYLDGSSVLIKKERAAAYKQEQAAKAAVATPPAQPPTGTPATPHRAIPGQAGSPATVATPKTRFYGTVSLDPVKAKLDFATIMDEVVQAFTSRPDAQVQISFEIQAEGRNGFNEALQRAIKENCNVLKFTSAEFDND